MSRPIEIILCRYEDGVLKVLAMRLWLKSALSFGSEDIDDIKFAAQVIPPWHVPHPSLLFPLPAVVSVESKILPTDDRFILR